MTGNGTFIESKAMGRNGRSDSDARISSESRLHSGFHPLVDLFLIRIWRQVSDITLRQVLHEWFGTGQTDLTQDEANAAAENRINELNKQLRDLDPSSTEHRDVSRQIELGRSLLVFDGTGFEETMTGVSQSMVAVADNPARERKWQAYA